MNANYSYDDEKQTPQERLREHYEDLLVAAGKTILENELRSVVREHAERVYARDREQRRQRLAERVALPVAESYYFMRAKRYEKAEEKLHVAVVEGQGIFTASTEPIAVAWRSLHANIASDLLQTNSFEEVLVRAKRSSKPTPRMEYAQAAAYYQLGNLTDARAHVITSNELQPYNPLTLTLAASIETAIASVSARRLHQYRRDGERDVQILNAGIDRLRESQRNGVGYCAGAITASSNSSKVFDTVARILVELRATQVSNFAMLNLAPLEATGFFERRFGEYSRTGSLGSGSRPGDVLRGGKHDK